MNPELAPENAGTRPSAEQVAQWVLAKQLQIISYTRMIVRDMHLAEDIFQEVCVAAIKAHNHFDSPEGTVRWAMKVARNRALDQLRRRRRQAPPLSPELLDKFADEWIRPTSPSHEEHFPDTTFEQLERCLNKLTPRSRELLRLRYGEGKKPSDIAVLLNRKIQAVYKAITRAHASVKTCMESTAQPKA